MIFPAPCLRPRYATTLKTTSKHRIRSTPLPNADNELQQTQDNMYLNGSIKRTNVSRKRIWLYAIEDPHGYPIVLLINELSLFGFSFLFRGKVQWLIGQPFATRHAKSLFGARQCAAQSEISVRGKCKVMSVHK